MAVKYGITGIPTAILVDQEGNVVSMQARGPRLGALLEKLLGKPSEDEASAVEVSDQSEQTAQNACSLTRIDRARRRGPRSDHHSRADRSSRGTLVARQVACA